MAFSFSSPSPQFANPQAQQQLFPQSSPFPSFPQQPQPQLQPQPQFQFQPQQQQQQQQQWQPQPQPQQQQQQCYLFTVDKAPASYSTKWADLHPDSQKLLLQIEEKILEYKDESQRLDQCSRLYDSSISSDGFELVTSHIIQELGGTSTAMERERVTVKELMAEVKNMMWNTEIAIRSYMMLRPRFLHQSASTISNGVSTSQTFGATMNSSMSNQPTSNSVASVYDFYYGLPKRPSPFMQHTVSRFEKCLIECYQWIEELEQLVLMDTDKTSSSSGLVLLQSLPNVMSNVHDFFVHVAAKVSEYMYAGITVNSPRMIFLAETQAFSACIFYRTIPHFWRFRNDLFYYLLQASDFSPKESSIFLFVGALLREKFARPNRNSSRFTPLSTRMLVTPILDTDLMFLSSSSKKSIDLKGTPVLL